MIYIFRKEIRKWYPILWLVFISLAISGIYGFFFRSPGSEIAIGNVNGTKILFSQYRRALSDIYSRIEGIKNYARQYGISSDIFIAGILGGRSPEQFAQEQCVHDALIDQVKKSINPQLDQQWFKDELIKMFPPGIVNEQGGLNMDIYQGYLQKMGVTPAQFETEKEEGLKRNMMLNFVRMLDYMPEHEIANNFEQKNAQKSFSILVFNLDDFIKKARKESVQDKDLELFYERHKESYRISEKRKVIYWRVDSQRYGRSIEIDEETITRFYERNKSTTFRNPPTVTVKRIFLPTTKENRQKVYEQAKELQIELKKNPDQFDQKMSQKSALKKNSVLTISGRGEHDSDIESAAFRLYSVGDISPVVRTNKGFEILQLASRVPAADKPLESVRDEIIKTLKARRSLSKLKNDLEMLIRAAKTDENSLKEFVSLHKLDEVQTDWLSSDQTEEKSIESELIKRIFTKHQTGLGFIPYEEDFVLFKVSGVQASKISPFHDVKDSVIDAFYESKGLDLLKEELKHAKASLLNKTASPEDLASKADIRLIKTGLLSQGVNKGTDIKELKHIAGLKPRLFVLTSQDQVLTYNHNNNEYLLAQLQELKPVQEDSFEQERSKIIKKEKMKGALLTSDAFIASLYRNAKIEFDEQLLGISKHK